MNRQDLIKKLDSIIKIGIVNAREDKAVLEEIREELQKPVMVITAGSYSDYHIECVTFERETAERISELTYDSNGIEVYVPIEWAEGSQLNYENETYLHVEWDPEKNKITSAKVEAYTGRNIVNSYGRFCFTVCIRSREAMDVLEHGKDSDLLKKVAQDKYAEYKAAELEKKYKMFGGE